MTEAGYVGGGGCENDSDEEDECGASELVGFLEDPPSAQEKKLLTRRMFPSKVGGKPAWLVPEKLPDLSCRKCSRPLRFLLQVYASRGSDHPGAFHRVLKLFICTSCQPNEVRAFRVQLPRENLFYSAEAPDQDKILASAHDDPELDAILCWDCGLPCQSQPAATSVDEDVEEVEAVDAGAVSNRCEECVRRIRNDDPPAVLDERELTCCEAEEAEEDHDDEADVEDEARDDASPDLAEDALKLASPAQDAGDAAMLEKLKEFRDHLEKDPEHALDRSEQDAFDEWSKKEGVKDDIFSKFQRFCNTNPGHVIRHTFEAEPLWFSSHGLLAEAPPACAACGAPRTFELQVQPQLIAHLCKGKADNDLSRRLDYGIVCVFVCKNSCSAGADAPYLEEFVHVQSEPTEAWLPKA